MMYHMPAAVMEATHVAIVFEEINRPMSQSKTYYGQLPRGHGFLGKWTYGRPL